MNEREFAAQMLLMAQKDLDSFKNMPQDPPFADEVFGFHAQQCIEKTLKACLTLLEVEYPRTHDLSELAKLLQLNGVVLDVRFRELLRLSSFAVEFRYEPSEPSDMPLDRVTLTRLAEDLISTMKTRFGIP